MIGRTLAHYEVTGLLGKGGMGEVYRARDTRLKRDIALKVLPTAVSSDPSRLERFQSEAEIVAGLSHPNIVTLHSVERSGDLRFLTMELVDGDGLDGILPADGFPLAKTLDIGAAVADALAAAHAGGVVHRDLKPANIMLTRSGHVKVLDFGLAKLTQEASPSAETMTQALELTGPGAVLGTVPYMSPEQLRAEPADPRSDIFSLGVLLFELATGRRPFAGDSSSELTSAILRDAPPLVTNLKPDLPNQLGRIVAKCLEKDPADRYQTALDLRNDLRALRRESRTGSAVPAPAPPDREHDRGGVS